MPEGPEGQRAETSYLQQEEAQQEDILQSFMRDYGEVLKNASKRGQDIGYHMMQAELRSLLENGGVHVHSAESPTQALVRVLKEYKDFHSVVSQRYDKGYQDGMIAMRKHMRDAAVQNQDDWNEPGGSQDLLTP